MKCYSVPYEGNQEYIFFSYCHEDAPLVYPIIERLSIEGFRVWYDNGIHPGDDWPEVIAAHLSRAKVCVAAISKASAESHNCRNEVSFAIANNKPFVSVLIEDFPMPLGMQLQLSSSNYIKKNDYSQEKFYQKLLSAPTIADCRKAGDSASPTAIMEWQNHVTEYEQGPLPTPQIVSRGFIIDPTWFEERKRLEEEIAALKKEQVEAERRLKQEKERLLAEKERRRIEEEQIQQERIKAEQERLAKEAKEKRQAEEARRKAEQERLVKEAEEKRRAEEARLKAEQECLAKEAEEKRQAEEARLKAEQECLAKEAEEKRQAEEARLKAEQERLAKEAEEKRRAEEARLKAEQERLAKEAEEKRRAEEARLKAERERLAKEAEEKRRAEEARRKAEQERLAKEAEEKRRAEEARLKAERERLAKEAESNGKVNLKKEFAGSEPGGSSMPGNGDAMLIRMGTGEIFKINSTPVRIGRANDSDIVFSGNRAISHSHLEIETDGKSYTLKNLSSSIVEVNGNPVQTAECVTLGEYAEITISNEQCFFVSGSAYCRIFEEHKLKMLRCKETGETRLFVDDVLPLNRYHKWRQNILGDQRISREHHAEIFRRGSQSIIRDVGSLHGTFLNAKRINTGEEALLQSGDTIAIVETEFIYYESTIG